MSPREFERLQLLQALDAPPHRTQRQLRQDRRLMQIERQRERQLIAEAERAAAKGA